MLDNVNLPDITPYFTVGGYFNADSSKSVSRTVSNNSISNSDTNILLKELIKLLSTPQKNNSTNIEIPLIIDGREIARAVAPYSSEIDKYNTRSPKFSY